MKHYYWTVKSSPSPLARFVSGSGVSAVSVVLPALADQPSYAPPPVTSVLTISYNTQARPVYAVKADRGVQ